MTLTTRTTRPSPTKSVSLSKKMAKLDDDLNILDALPEEEISRDIIADNNSPVDRRILTRAFTTIYYQFSINQADIADAAGVSSPTISNIVSRGKLVSWDAWQLIIAGLIKYKLTHAYFFWVALPPCIRDKIALNTANPVILQYIAEYKKIVTENDESIIKSTNELLSQLSDTSPELLNQIHLPGSINSPLSGTLPKPSNDSQINNGIAILNFQGGTQSISQLTFVGYPDMNNEQILGLINGLIKKNNTEISEEDINLRESNNKNSN